jgi:hypothetical protein
MSMRTRIENRLAVQAGVDLPWLDQIAPDVAIRWRREHDAQISTAFYAEIASL